jgi:hypothetical protein
MAGIHKPTPMEAFELNIADARWLIRSALVLQNQRVRRMRSELRTRNGDALRIPERDQERLDCIESDDLFIVIKPDSSIDRDHVAALDPLLRQSLVAACAALETYVADAACDRVGVVIRSKGPLPRYLGQL